MAKNQANFPVGNWHYNDNEIEAEIAARKIKRSKIRIRVRFGYDGFFLETILLKRRSRFGSAEFFRQFKRKKRKGFTRIEPPTLVRANPFIGTSREAYQPDSYVIKGAKSPKYNVNRFVYR